MANIVFKVGALDLSQYIRVNPNEHLELGQGDMLEPAFSDSPFFEGQTLTSVHAKNKELKVPLFLHPPTSPYTNDALAQLVQQVNQALRPVNDLGITTYAEWKNAQAVNSTFFTIQFARFEPDYNFRITEKGWLAGTLHIWVLPFAHTATERIVATAAAPVSQSGMQILPSAILTGALKSVPSNLITAQNLVPNPGLQYGATGWVNGFGPLFPAASLGVITDGASPALRYITDGNHNNEGVAATLAFPMAPGNYFISFQARASAGADNLSLIAEDWQTGLGGQLSQVYGLATAYGTFVGTWTLTATLANPALFFSKTASGVGMQMIKNVMVTRAGGPTSYFDGDGASAAWEGAPGNSVSDLLTFDQSIQGDVPPQMDLRMTVGSYLADDGRLGIISALPIPSYTPIIPVGSFIGKSPSAVIQGASGAWASQYLAIDAGVAGGSGGPGYFSFAVSPGSVYQGDNRVLGLVRGRFTPFGLRAFDPRGNPIGPTVIASALDGWQLVDYGALRIPPWMPTAVVGVQVYGGIDYTASGMFSPRRVAPAWAKEIGPVFVLPNQSTVLDLDWDSSIVAMDGFDGISGAAVSIDSLGNSWTVTQGTGVMNGLSGMHPGTGIVTFTGRIGTVVSGDYEIETIWNQAGATGGAMNLYVARTDGTNQLGVEVQLYSNTQNFWALYVDGVTFASQGLTAASGAYHLKFTSRGGQVWANVAGPSGLFAGSASGIMASLGMAWPQASRTVAYPWISFGEGASTIPMVVHAFRARSLSSQGYQSRDILHLYQPLTQNTRMTPSSIDAVDLQARQRGAVQAPQLPVPSLGAGLFVASFPWDQGPANDLLNVDVRMRERFTYAR